MKMPIPGDWDGETWKCVEVLWPESETYLGILRGELTELARGPYWDPRSGNIADAQVVGRAIAEYNVPLNDCQDCSEADTVIDWRPSIWEYRLPDGTDSATFVAGLNYVEISPIPVVDLTDDAVNVILDPVPGRSLVLSSGYMYFVRFIVQGIDVGRFRAVLRQIYYPETQKIVYGTNARAVGGVNSTQVSILTYFFDLREDLTHVFEIMMDVAANKTAALGDDDQRVGTTELYSVLEVWRGELLAVVGEQGPPGPQGIQGIQGLTGPQGETGPQGLPGEDAPDEFILLSDTPAAYAGNQRFMVRVNEAQTGLEFIHPCDAIDECDVPNDFLDLLDTPEAYAGNQRFIVRVNEEQSALEFVHPCDAIDECDVPNDFLDLLDTPEAYTDHAGKLLIVNPTEEGITFADACEVIQRCLDAPPYPVEEPEPPDTDCIFAKRASAVFENVISEMIGDRADESTLVALATALMSTFLLIFTGGLALPMVFYIASILLGATVLALQSVFDEDFYLDLKCAVYCWALDNPMGATSQTDYGQMTLDAIRAWGASRDWGIDGAAINADDLFDKIAQSFTGMDFVLQMELTGITSGTCTECDCEGGPLDDWDDVDWAYDFKVTDPLGEFEEDYLFLLETEGTLTSSGLVAYDHGDYCRAMAWSFFGELGPTTLITRAYAEWETAPGQTYHAVMACNLIATQPQLELIDMRNEDSNPSAGGTFKIQAQFDPGETMDENNVVIFTITTVGDISGSLPRLVRFAYGGTGPAPTLEYGPP